MTGPGAPLSRIAGLPIPAGALEAAIARVHGRRVEHVVLLDRTGTEVWRGQGSRRAVAHPVIPDTVAVHNHPDGGAELSHTDVQSCLTQNELGVVAVGADRWSGLFRAFPRWAAPPLAVQFMTAWRDTGAPPPMETLARLVGGRWVTGQTTGLEGMEA